MRQSDPYCPAVNDPSAGLFVVMGVAGSGKSVIGGALARGLGVDFVDGDDYHPPENVAKMARGVPLTDRDRAEWLRTLERRLEQANAGNRGIVVACSALKRSYRDVLREAGAVRFIFLRGPRELLLARLVGRRGHFMPASLLDSQFATLEEPGADEDAWVVDVSASPDTIVADLLRLAMKTPS